MWSRLNERLFGWLDKVLADDRRNTRGQRVKPPLGPLIAVVTVAVLLMACCLASPQLLMAFNNRPGEVAYRMQGIAVIHREMARLPACATCTQIVEGVTNGPGQPIRVITRYQIVESVCDTVVLGDYYQPLLTAAGWQVGTKTATKTVGDYHLRFSLACESISPYYAVTIEAEEPFL